MKRNGGMTGIAAGVVICAVTWAAVNASHVAANDGSNETPRRAPGSINPQKVLPLSSLASAASEAPSQRGLTSTRGAISVRTRLQPQFFLNRIAYKAYPDEALVGSKPTRASIAASSISYRTNCRDTRRGGVMAWFYRSRYGSGFRACSAMLPPIDIDRRSRPKEYEPTMRKLGHILARSAKIGRNQNVLRIWGNRKKLSFKYACPPELIAKGALERVTIRTSSAGPKILPSTCH